MTENRRVAERRKGLVRFLLLEGLVVVLGVLAALAVDQWREDAERAGAVDAARAGVVAEVGRNLDELVETGERVAERHGRLEALLGSGEAAGVPLAEQDFGGFRLPELSTAAWERASRGALGDHLPPAFVEDAFSVYRLLDELERLGEHVRDLTFSRSYHDPADGATNARLGLSLMEHQLRWIEQLVAGHCTFLEEHGTDPLPLACPRRDGRDGREEREG